MSKITFRADDDLIDRLEERDTSKSESMRRALRQYLDGAPSGTDVDRGDSDADAAASLDELVAERIDDLLAERTNAFARPEPRDVNVNIALEGDSAETTAVETDVSDENPESRKTRGGESSAASNTPQTCDQCGEDINGEFVYCPNCGEKASHRVFCDCGDELRSDWAFCPSCGRRTPAADVLDS